MADTVYILTNPTMPDLVKLGVTADLKEELKLLNSYPGVAAPFECHYHCEVEDGTDVKRRLAIAFGEQRVNTGQDFFRVEPERLRVILEALSSKNRADPVIEEAPKPKGIFRFSKVGIKVGSELSFVYDKKITCRVSSDRNVEFQGSAYSLSSLALKLVNEVFGKNRTTIRGPSFWVFEGETLTKRRGRMEAEPLSDDYFKLDP